MLPMPNLWTNMCVENWTLERMNTDYDPASVVSTAQSNNNIVIIDLQYSIMMIQKELQLVKLE